MHGRRRAAKSSDKGGATMRFRCTIVQLPDSRWRARHAGGDLGVVEATGATREETLEKIRLELRYRLELCPCSGESYQHVAIELVEPDR
jgi:hypothetical protein